MVTNIDNDNKNIQYLDSGPEKEFLEKIIDEINERDMLEEVLFFAKLPSLGSNVYFEYFSKENFSIHKSYLDFALITRSKTLLIEVKSLEKDYNRKKTEDLIIAYGKYMQSQNGEKNELIVYLTSEDKETGAIQREIYIYDKDKMVMAKISSVRKIFDKIFSV